MWSPICVIDFRDEESNHVAFGWETVDNNSSLYFHFSFYYLFFSFLLIKYNDNVFSSSISVFFSYVFYNFRYYFRSISDPLPARVFAKLWNVSNAAPSTELLFNCKKETSRTALSLLNISWWKIKITPGRISLFV